MKESGNPSLTLAARACGLTADWLADRFNKGRLLDQPAAQASLIDSESLSTRFSTDSISGEFGPISELLNNLLARLEQSFEQERRFSADLAHELRTPIAELRSVSDLALKWPDSRPAETERDTLAIALQMEGIVVRLLDLLRSERGQLVPKVEEVQPAQLLKSSLRPFADSSKEKQLVRCERPYCFRRVY